MRPFRPSSREIGRQSDDASRLGVKSGTRREITFAEWKLARGFEPGAPLTFTSQSLRPSGPKARREPAPQFKTLSAEFSSVERRWPLPDPRFEHRTRMKDLAFLITSVAALLLAILFVVYYVQTWQVRRALISRALEEIKRGNLKAGCKALRELRRSLPPLALTRLKEQASLLLEAASGSPSSLTCHRLEPQLDMAARRELRSSGVASSLIDTPPTKCSRRSSAQRPTSSTPSSPPRSPTTKPESEPTRTNTRQGGAFSTGRRG
jgi:hypothetical protein